MTGPVLGRSKKRTIRPTRLIKLEPIRDETNSLADLVRYANTSMILSISTLTISRIQHGFLYTTEEAKSNDEIESTGVTNIFLGLFKDSQRCYSATKAIIKYLIEYIFDVFAVIELILAGHRSELIEEKVSVSGHLLRVMVVDPRVIFDRKPELIDLLEEH